MGLQESKPCQHPLITLSQLRRSFTRLLLQKAAVPRPERLVPNQQGFAGLPHLRRHVIPELFLPLLFLIAGQFLVIQALIFLHPLSHGFLLCQREIRGLLGLLAFGRGGCAGISMPRG